MVLGVAFAAIVARLVYVQGFAGGRYQAYANRQDTQYVVLRATRGAILDRNGIDLALSESRSDVVADPHQISRPATEAKALAPLVGVPVSKLTALMSRKAGFVYLAKALPVATGAAVDKLLLPGITIQATSVRFHPAGQLAMPLLGTVQTSGAGSGGIEYKYDKVLQGTSGQLVQRVDPSGQPLPGGLIRRTPAVRGDDVVLTIDQSLQYQTEQALAQAIVAAKAKRGMAVIMDRRTGALLAVADLSAATSSYRQPSALPVPVGPGGTILAAGTPTSQPQPVESPSASAFTQVFEPGSIEKLITVSAALNQHKIGPQEVFTIPNGYPVAGTTFHDAEVHPTEQLAVTGILAQSSNIGAIQIAQKLGAQSLYAYQDAFGVHSQTAVHFPGEAAGLRPKINALSGTSLATMAFGQGMAVTAVQMLAAYNTIANGGVYVPPHLVSSLVGPQGQSLAVAHPAPHRVVSAKVAAEITPMFEQVVSAGTGLAAAISPYAVAGKTGTANALAPTGGYLNHHVVSSFAGFAPAQNPAVSAIVVIDDTTQYGAQAAAPSFSVIVRDALSMLQVPPAGPQPPASVLAGPLPGG